MVFQWPLLLYCELHNCFSGFFFTHDYSGLELGISPPMSIRLWFTIFSGGRTLLRRWQCSGIFQNDFFSSPCQVHEGVSFWYLARVPDAIPRGKSRNIVGLPCDWVPLKLLTLRVVHTDQPSSNLSVMV